MLRTIVTVSVLLGWSWGSAAGQPQSQQPTLYRLAAESAYLEGCIDGLCLCPVLFQDGLSGSFVLTPEGQDGSFLTFLVEDLQWVVAQDPDPLFITGSGRYRFDPNAELQQLELELVYGDGSVELFDSNLVPLVTGPPALALVITRNQPCYDIGFQIDAEPDDIIATSRETWGTLKLHYR